MMRTFSVDINRLISLRVIILAMAIFFINNIIGIVFLGIYIVVNKSDDNSEYIMLFSFLALFLGMINAGKVPESDLEGYHQQFLLCGKIPFWEYLSLKVKEPAFWLFTYVVYYLTAGSFSLYIILCTFFMYFFLFYSLYKFYLYLNKPELILYSVFCITFFTPFFSLSAHLVRQLIAASLIMFFIVENVFYNKNRLLILVCAVFIHSSAWFFAPFIFLKFFKKKINAKKLLAVIPITILLAKYYVVIFKFLTKITSGIPAISYVFSRLTKDITESGEGLGLLPLLLFIGLVCISVYVLYIRGNEDKRVIHFLNLFLILSFFVFLTQDQDLLSLRFYFYSYSFLPFILFIPTNVKNTLYKFPLSFLVASLLIMFIVKLDKGVWTYDSIQHILSYNIMDFFVRI